MDLKNKTKGQDNFGGVFRIFACPMSKLTEFPIVLTDGVFNMDIFVDDNALWSANKFEIKFIPETAVFKQTTLTTDAGKVFKQQLECIVAKDYFERDAVFIDMDDERFLVFIFDSNRQARVVGWIEVDGEKNGARFVSDSDTGTAYSSLNYIKLMITCESHRRALSLGADSNSAFSIPAQDALS